MTVDQRQRYLFDTAGYVRIERLLDVNEVDALLRRLDERKLNMRFQQGCLREDDLVTDPAFMAIASERLAPFALAAINQPLRIIESYVINRRPNFALPLHNGLCGELVLEGGIKSSLCMSIYHTAHAGQLYCMFVKALLFLSDVLAPADGPFCYVEGSHKANFPFPWSRDPTRSGYLEHHDLGSLRTVFAAAGDVILMNEALLHGAKVKLTTSDRWLFVVSFAPAFVTRWRPLDRAPNDLLTGGHCYPADESDYWTVKPVMDETLDKESS